MEYIINTKLSGKGKALQRNVRSTKPTEYNKTQVSSDEGTLLPLFSALPDPHTTITRLMDIYELDLKLFGYDYKIVDGNVMALCVNDAGNSQCC